MKLTGPGPFVVALVAYIALGLVVKSVVLNWIVGPLFPLVALYLVPRVLGRGDERAPDGHR